MMGKLTEADYENMARAAGWQRRYSHFTRHGTSIAYVDWKTLCLAERLALSQVTK